jgi:hypothetical protein
MNIKQSIFKVMALILYTVSTINIHGYTVTVTNNTDTDKNNKDAAAYFQIVVDYGTNYKNRWIFPGEKAIINVGNTVEFGVPACMKQFNVWYKGKKYQNDLPLNLHCINLDLELLDDGGILKMKTVDGDAWIWTNIIPEKKEPSADVIKAHETLNSAFSQVGELLSKVLKK